MCFDLSVSWFYYEGVLFHIGHGSLWFSPQLRTPVFCSFFQRKTGLIVCSWDTHFLLLRAHPMLTFPWPDSVMWTSLAMEVHRCHVSCIVCVRMGPRTASFLFWESRGYCGIPGAHLPRTLLGLNMAFRLITCAWGIPFKHVYLGLSYTVRVFLSISVCLAWTSVQVYGTGTLFGTGVWANAELLLPWFLVLVSCLRRLVCSLHAYSVSCSVSTQGCLPRPLPAVTLPWVMDDFHLICYRFSGSSDLISSFWCHCASLESSVSRTWLQHVSLLMLVCPDWLLGPGMLLLQVPTSLFTSLILFGESSWFYYSLLILWWSEEDNAGCSFSPPSVSGRLILDTVPTGSLLSDFWTKNIISCYFHGFLFHVYNF